MKKKEYLIDTSVIIENPANNLYHLFQNGENNIYITEIVLKELDKHKTSQNQEVGIAARTFFRAINNSKFKKVKKKKILNGDTLFKANLFFEEINSNIKIFILKRDKYKEDSYQNDFKIMEVAKDYKLTLVTNDTSFKVIGLSEGIKAQSLKYNSVLSPENISFSKEINLEEDSLNNLHNMVDIKNWNQLYINIINDKKELTGKQLFFIKKNNHFEKIRSEKEEFKELYIKPKNLEQKFYVELLESKFNIMVVTGSTGSGKTLLAVQEAMRRVKDKNDPINGIVYMRYTVNTNDKFAELGYRSGNEEQKLGYYNYPLYSAINFILENKMKKEKESAKKIEEIKSYGINKNEETEKIIKDYNISITDIAHARGITISNKIVIFDEVQNAPNSILKLIGTRLGDNSPIILMGDFKQVDHPYLSKEKNALVTMLRLAEKSNDIAAIQLKSTVRSEVAEWFEQNLK